MSQENVEIVRLALDAFAQRGLDAAAEYWTDDIEHRSIPGAVDDRGPMHGKDAVRTFTKTGSTRSMGSGPSRWS
jgi:ketosteroid isomerase-like protein